MAKRLIDADAAAERLSFEGVMQYPQGWGMGVLAAISTIRSFPTVDAVEVVRCRDCKWFDKGSLFKHSRCKHLSGMTFPSANDFCSCGKRRKGEHEDGEQGEKDEQGRESVLDLLRHPDGRPDIRYNGIVSGAFAQTMCEGCPKAVYGGACQAPAFPPKDGKPYEEPAQTARGNIIARLTKLLRANPYVYLGKSEIVADYLIQCGVTFREDAT